MKTMNYNEFQHRILEVNKAYRIFRPLTNNMTDAFRLYQEVLAEEQMEVFVSTVTHGNRPMTPMDDYERPKCPDCQSSMWLRMVPQNEDGIQTQLVCSNDQCDTVLDSQLCMSEWQKVLKKK